MRRWAAGTVLLLAASVVAAVVAARGTGSEDSSAAASQATRTTTIRRQDLVETETVDGTLGYSDPRTVVNRLSGTVTWTPRVGAVIRTNHRLYEVDGRAVYLLDGSYPAYRTMKAGLEGGDVRQFERNLRELGLDEGRDMKVDGSWDSGTTAAAKRWQKRKGMEQDGTIDKGRVVFQPGSRRVGELQIAAGASAAGGAGGSAASATTASYDESEATTVFAVATQAEGETPATTETTPAPAQEQTQTQPEATTPATTEATPEATTPDGEDDTGTAQEQAPADGDASQQQEQRPQQGTGGAGGAGSAPSAGSAQGQASGGGGAGAGTGAGADTGAGAGTAAGGDAAGADADVSSAMMTTTSTRRIVSVDLEATRQALAEEGDRVSVELPDGRDVAGTLLRVGKVAEKKATAQDDDPPATVELVITLGRSAGTGLDQAPVDVRLEKRRAKDVLTVPVTALLARAGGEFAVEVREGERRRVVAVETGLYTDSYVEIEGEGLRPGLTVTNAGV